MYRASIAMRFMKRIAFWLSVRVERAIGGQRERGGVGHVAVQHHRMAGDAVDRAVDEQGGRLDAVAAGQHLAVHVDQHDVVGADLAPVQAARVDQVAVVRRPGQRDAEVVADAFGQAVVGGGAQRQRKVLAQACDRRAGVLGVRLSAVGRGQGAFECFKHFLPQTLMVPA